MSFYKKDSPSHLDQAFESLRGQTLAAEEIILIQDGQVGKELEQIVEKWTRLLPIRLYVNKENIGLGLSLKRGLELCSFEIVARMDSDDICHPNRFEHQFKFLSAQPNISVVGSWIAEFSDSIEEISNYRKLPSEPHELFYFAKKRCPLNHPTVMYRKSDINNVGSYFNFRFQQDYHLWGRLLNSGYKIANIPESLVYMRVDERLFNRRGGLRYFQIETQVQKTFLDIGFINKLEFVRNYIIRGSIRLVPNSLRKIFYETFLR
ncbi:glycosyltransferase [Algoriphagus resistens]|uniref:glycosyltransferase n=1 Tax=Algoriphagus resistens TaxID=1750590 RepID=UPI000716ACE0|nr:glycosyltransferase [Algoriphagus resistens]